MIRKRLFWQFYVSYMIITCIVLVLISSYAYRHVSKFYFEETAKDLEARTYLVSGDILSKFETGDYAGIDELCKTLGQKADTRITVITPAGKVLGDSGHDPDLMENHADRPEITKAKNRQIGVDKRYSATIKQWMEYIAVPMIKENEVVLIIRSSKPLTAIDTRLKEIFTQGAKFILIIAVVAAAVSLFISQRINRPLEEIKKGAELFAKGNLDSSLAVPKTHELSALANSLNKMAVELNDRITTITNQKNQTQAILSSMNEGVIAINSMGQILSINQAACRLLDIDANNVIGKLIEETVRNFDLQDFISKILTNQKHYETEITINDTKPQYMHIYGDILIGDKKQKIGAIIVMQDITLLRQLERVRSEFVANVSHELKTPITSIKGFVETLLDGAIDRYDEARRFLTIISRQTNRLTAIIEDLLILSKVEDPAQRGQIIFEPMNICQTINTAVEICQIKAKEKNIQISVDCKNESIEINEFLIEQALVNLISNAVKYSDQNKTVSITTNDIDRNIEINIQDHGYGIASEHLERVFERFYVTDKARSRNLGGTGLGLAIVKHIAAAHNGSVSVKSTLGQGSIFTIRLPKIQIIKE